MKDVDSKTLMAGNMRETAATMSLRLIEWLSVGSAVIRF
jgi:hypothetical protein